MKIHVITLFALLLMANFCQAQQQNPPGKFYGISTIGTDGKGMIFSYDPTSNEIDTFHNFVDVSSLSQERGSRPVGPLLKANNGLLYGVTSEGGIPFPDWVGPGLGLIYSFDPQNNSFTKLHDINGQLMIPESQLMQASDGKLYGTSKTEYTGVYSFDYNTNAYAATVMSIFNGEVFGPVVEALPGKLFGVLRPGRYSDYYSIFSFDIQTKQSTVLWGFSDVDFNEIWELTLAGNGKLYWVYSNAMFEFDPANPSVEQVYQFVGATGTAPYQILTKGDDGLLYGTTSSGGNNNKGVIFSFNSLTKEYNALYHAVGSEIFYESRLTEGNGKFYGASTAGIFSFDKTTNAYKTELNYGLQAGATLTYVAPPVCNVPVPVVSGNSPVCEGTTLQLSASGGTSYQWTGPANFSSAIAQPSIDNINASNAGTYYVRVENSTLCYAMDSIIVEVSALPVAEISAGGPLTFCEGDSVILTATEGTEWLWSNGLTTKSVTVKTSGTYTVNVTNQSGCTAGSPSVSVVVSPYPTAMITTDGPLTFCEGDSVLLTASAGTSWLWSNGLTTQSVSVKTSGSFSVNVTNASGCAAISAAVTTVVSPSPLAEITVDGPLSFCEGDSVVLTASAGAQWLWNNGMTTKSIAAKSAGNYTVSITNEQGCTSISSATQVSVTTIPVKPVIVWNGAQLSVAAGYMNYNWSLNGVLIQSATSNVYTPLQPGLYGVMVSSGNCSNSADNYEVQINGSPIRVGTTELYGYPNPVRDQFKIYRKNDFNKMLKIKIVDMNGRVFLEQSFTGSLQTISLSRLPAGIYTVLISDQSSRSFMKIVKQ